jgi:hypothetical protein
MHFQRVTSLGGPSSCIYTQGKSLHRVRVGVDSRVLVELTYNSYSVTTLFTN